MAAFNRLEVNTTYLNPVYERPFADPFVLKYRGEYWGYCTGFWYDEKCFGVLHSRDLIHWRELGGAMEPLPFAATCYWAPEVVYESGRFLMYYSVGNEVQMQIRVAAAELPEGPFVDTGHRLTDEEFAIDPHIFIDDDGVRYFFYATDFLKYTHIGTGTVYDRMLDDWTLAGQPRPVTRARYDWQVYDPQRMEKGGVRWHTVEGPFVLKHKGRYYQMFSGGNWKYPTYGVSYATSDRIDRSDEWTQDADGQQILPILRTIPGRVIGPGHNSVIRGPDNRQLFCVYHCWTPEQNDRVMAIDRLDWAGEKMLVLGPTTTPQPTPIAPTVSDLFDEVHTDGLGPNWDCSTGGRWFVRDGEAVQESIEGAASARCMYQAPCFVAELSMREFSYSGMGEYGVALYSAEEDLLHFMLVPATGLAIVSTLTIDGWTEHKFTLPKGFEPKSYHHFRIEVDNLFAHLALDDATVRWEGSLAGLAGSLAMVTHESAAAFAGFALTVGWEDLFTRQDNELTERGWRPDGSRDTWHLKDQQLWFTDTEFRSFITRGPVLESYEMVVSAKLNDQTIARGCYGFYPAVGVGDLGPLVTVEHTGEGWSLLVNKPSGKQTFSLPVDFNPHTFQLFLFRKQQGRLTLQWEALALGETEVPTTATQVGLYVNRTVAVFDMVRVTVL